MVEPFQQSELKIKCYNFKSIVEIGIYCVPAFQAVTKHRLEVKSTDKLSHRRVRRWSLLTNLPNFPSI